MTAEIGRETINDLIVERAGDSGPRILFVHGSSGGSWYWHAFMGYFAELGYQCYAVNLRGHGPNPAVPDLGKLSMRDYVDDVRGVVDALGEVILVGHSMGGAIAQVVAQDASLRAAVFASPAPVAGVKYQRPPMDVWSVLHGIKAVPALLRRKSIKPGYRAAASSLFNGFEPGERKQLWKQLQPESATVAVEVMKGSVQADLSGVRIPMLCVVGSEDQATIPSMVREIAEFHGIGYQEFPDHGHMFMIEPGWETCAQHLESWLRDNLRE